MDKVEADKIVKDALENNVADLEVKSTDMAHTLEEIGVDSLDVMMIIMEVQDVSGVDIPDDVVGELDTPDKISQFILRTGAK